MDGRKGWGRGGGGGGLLMAKLEIQKGVYERDGCA